MELFSTAALERALREALAQRSEVTDALSQDDFSKRYAGTAKWAVGPFEKDDSLTFSLNGQWADPTGIGWSSESIFNPSVISDGEDLVLFYRASPRKESTSSRIGMARHTAATGWTDSAANPVVFPTLDNEILGVEDPKIYRLDGRYFLFYNGIFAVTEDDRAQYPSPGYPVETVGCDINLAVSDDLVTWTKLGPILGHDISRLWAKGAVIPRGPEGEPVKIDGQYLMYLSEGCDGVAHVGRSTDMINWTFTPQPYLDLTPLGGHLHEVACAIIDPEHPDTLVLDFFYGDVDDKFAAAQARYDLSAPFTQLELNLGGSLSWGGLIKRDNSWFFSQGWDAPTGSRELYFYREATAG